MGKIRVLLADDHVMFREGMRSLLERWDDLEVVGEAGDGVEAVRLASEHLPDIALLDIVMPNLNGVEATKQIKKVSPSTAVLVLTAYEDDRFILGLLEAGAAGYLLKSARGDEVVGAIRAVRAGESVLHPSVISRLVARAAHTNSAQARRHEENQLTDREFTVLKLAAKGMRNKDIAEVLVVSIPTVKAHLVNVFNKLGVGSRTEAVLLALRRGWLDIESVSHPEP